MEVSQYYINTALCQPFNFELSYERKNNSAITVKTQLHKIKTSIFYSCTKDFIFRCKCREEIPETIHFINYFKNMLKVVKAISTYIKTKYVITTGFICN